MEVIQVHETSRAQRRSGVALNLAIGPSCFVRCSGCYNLFGETARRGGLVSAAEVATFVRHAAALGVSQVTVSGGDPLSHPELITILRTLREIGVYIKMDTVGTAFLRDAQQVFFGSTETPMIDAGSVAPLVDMIGFPLDGASPEVQSRFRKAPRGRRAQDDPELSLSLPAREPRRGRAISSADVTADTQELVRIFSGFGVRTCVNTVLHSGNLGDVQRIATQVARMNPDLWQLFEFQASGVMAQRNADKFRISRPRTPTVVDFGRSRPIARPLFDFPEHSFERAVAIARSAARSVQVEAKSATERSHIYFIVNDAGIAWIPAADDQRPLVIGHIARDIDTVLNALSFHLTADAG